VATLVTKCQRALEQTGFKRLVLAGGVSANQLLREELNELALVKSWELFYPRLEFCTDNGAMIALVGALRLKAAQVSDHKIIVKPRWALTELAGI
jgi:N6-L-threonylcarbamoyladenine synthase